MVVSGSVLQLFFKKTIDVIMHMITIITILVNFGLHGKEWSVYIATGDEVGLQETHYRGNTMFLNHKILIQQLQTS